MRRFLAISLVVGSVVFAASCGPDPEVPGDECDLEDGCPAGLVCDGPEDEAICKIPPGGACTPEAENFCLGNGTCQPNESGGGTCTGGKGSSCDPAVDSCGDGLACVETEGSGYQCHEPVLLTGMVFDAGTEEPIEGAHVIALDDQSTVVTDVGVSDAMGNYQLSVPVPRQANGALAETQLTLRASAADYQTFPGGVRTALPISTADADAQDDGSYTIDTALTDIALIPLPADQQGLGSISGRAAAGGVLVVAEGDVAISGVADDGGDYTIFNVPDGSYTVSGYAAGVQLVPAEATVAGSLVPGVDLALSSDALGSVAGNVQIVNAFGGAATSVVLVVESTFDDTFARGDVPRGLRTPLSGAPSVTGAFSIEGVPAGKYVVLAAFENDQLVRDPDPNIAGTQIVHLTMPAPGEAMTLSEAFKITEALEIVSPGADGPEAVSGNLSFEWVDDSSEEFYSITVYDSFGELVWEDDNVPSVSGGNVTVSYGGPSLQAGFYYQFRATSWRQPGGNKPPGPIAQTEDLLGVFYVGAAE